MGILHYLNNAVVQISIVIAILSVATFSVRNTSERSEIAQTIVRASNSPFFIAHVLDPTNEDYRYSTWRLNDWLNWLNHREVLLRAANPDRKPLRQKGINSVIVASASQILDAFEGRQHPYDPDSRLGEYERDIYWSDRRFSSFVFLKHKNSFRVYACPPMYVALEFHRGIPVHLHEHGSKRERRSKVKFSVDCVLVPS